MNFAVLFCAFHFLAHRRGQHFLCHHFTLEVSGKFSQEVWVDKKNSEKMAQNASTAAIFSAFQQYLDAEQDKREVFLVSLLCYFQTRVKSLEIGVSFLLSLTACVLSRSH